jgi:hypothetical protein
MPLRPSEDEARVDAPALAREASLGRPKKIVVSVPCRRVRPFSLGPEPPVP